MDTDSLKQLIEMLTHRISVLEAAIKRLEKRPESFPNGLGQGW